MKTEDGKTMAMPEGDVAVVIATHNPNLTLFRRALECLRQQTLPRETWRLLIVSSATLPPAIQTDLPGNAPRVIVDSSRGITRARVRAYRETQEALVVLVDDDNFIAPDYLQSCVEIATQHPNLGVWGGQCLPDYEQSAEPWTREFWPYLALRELDRDYWCNWPDITRSPYGAGMCIRRPVIDRYLEEVGSDPTRAQLSGGEDNDIAFVACDLGLGMGLFRRLVLQHYVSANRITESYLLKRVEEAQRSCVWLEYLRCHNLNLPAPPTLGQRLLHGYHRFRMNPRSKRFLEARERGRARGYLDLHQLKRGEVPS